PAAIAAPAPEEEPAGLRFVFQGLRVTPCRLETPEASMPKSGMVVLPRKTQPASRSRATGGASARPGVMSPAAVPIGAGQPFVPILSLMVTGTPSSGLRSEEHTSELQS